MNKRSKSPFKNWNYSTEGNRTFSYEALSQPDFSRPAIQFTKTETDREKNDYFKLSNIKINFTRKHKIQKAFKKFLL